MLAHGALAALIVDNMPPISSPVSAAAAALAELDVDNRPLCDRCGYLQQTLFCGWRQDRGPEKQAGDAQMLAMQWCLALVSVNGDPAIAAAIARCDAACAFYDEGLRLPVSAIDMELLEHKTRTLHGLICWSVEHANNAPLPQPLQVRSASLSNAPKALSPFRV